MSRVLQIAAGILVLMHVSLAPSAAQGASTPPLLGNRARVHAPNFHPGPITGTITAYTADSLFIRSESDSREYHLSLRAISRYDPYKGGSRGSSARFHGALWGFVGASIGAVVAPIVPSQEYRASTRVLMGAAGGLVLGGALGASYGATFPRDRWGWVIHPWGYDPNLRP
jgi:hypothetical protein